VLFLSVDTSDVVGGTLDWVVTADEDNGVDCGLYELVGTSVD